LGSTLESIFATIIIIYTYIIYLNSDLYNLLIFF